MSGFEFDVLKEDLSTCLFSLEELDNETQKMVGKYHLSYKHELSSLARLVYSYLSFESLCFANAIHVFLWILDDIVDNPNIDIDVRKDTVLQCKHQIKNEKCDFDKHVCSNSEKETPSSFFIEEDLNSSRHLDNCFLNNCPIMISHFFRSLLDQPIVGILKNYICEQFEDYLNGVLEHLSLDETQYLSISDYTRIRSSDGACEVVWPLVLLDASIEEIKLGIFYLSSHNGKQARNAATLNVSFVNDIISYRNDLACGTKFNIILVWMNECGGEDEASAICKIKSQCNAHYNLIVTLKSRCINDIQTTILDRLLLWCRCSLYWHKKAKRYMHDE